MIEEKNKNRKKIPLDNSNLILRGCNLKNTKFIIGLVCYTGHYTKIMLNSVKARSKKSRVEKIMNFQVFNIFVAQILFSLFSGFFAAFWYLFRKNNLSYLDIKLNAIANNTFWYNIFVRFGNWLLIFT